MIEHAVFRPGVLKLAMSGLSEIEIAEKMRRAGADECVVSDLIEEVKDVIAARYCVAFRYWGEELWQ